MKKIVLIAALLMVGLTACQKKDATAPDPSQVVINITSPLPGQVFHKGDTVHIVANVSYPSELHGYELKLTDTSSGFIVYDEAQDIHNDHFTIDDKWVNTASAVTDIQLELIANVDHTGDVARKTFFIRTQP